MLLYSLNLNHLRVFECVYRTGSTIAAAKELHLTQSGISQHIKSLEESLGCGLFDRIGRRLIPTHDSTRLYRECYRSMFNLEKAISLIKGSAGELSGNVSIGMQSEFGCNRLMEPISAFCRMYRDVNFSISLGLASETNKKLLGGELDFAFVDEFAVDKRVTVEPVYEERLSLCASQAYLKKLPGPFETLKAMRELDYVDYIEGAPVLKLWFNHHFGSKAGGVHELNVRATATDVQAVSRLITSGAGAGILPEHHVEKLERARTRLHRFKGSGKPLVNRIHLAYLQERTLSKAAMEALSHIRKALARAGQGKKVTPDA